MTDLAQLTSADLAAHINQQFHIHDESLTPIEAELIDVSEMGSKPAKGRHPFSIVLRTAQKDHHLIQAIYRVEHAELGTLELFLVPLGPDKHGMRYEAVFT